MCALKIGAGDALLVAAAQLGVENLFEHSGLALNSGHDAAQVPGLDRVPRHLEGHTRDLGVPLSELAAAPDDAGGKKVVHEARLGLESVCEFLAGVGPLL